MSPAEYEIMIIGGGPAGLSAASSIVRQDHKTILFDSSAIPYRNSKSRHLHTVAAWDHADPHEFLARARADLDRYGSVHVVRDTVVSLTRREKDGLFEAVVTGDGGSENSKSYVAKKVILATGVEDIFPDIEGYAECWITGIFHCLYCHGWEERGVPSAGMLAQGEVSNVLLALHFARQALQISESVTLYTNGNDQLATDLRAALETPVPAQTPPPPMTVDARKITKLSKAPHRAQITLHFADGTTKTEGFLAHKPSTKVRGDLAMQLGLGLTSKGIIAVSPPFNQTTLKGVFAAGDCCSPMQTITAALHSGTCAGGGVPLQIQAERDGQKAIFE